MSPEFLLTSFLVVLAPGTGVLYTLAVGLSQGRLAGIFAAIGCTLGILPHLAASLLGLAALLHTSALAYQALKIIGLLYLLYLAYETLREKGALAIEPRPNSPTSTGGIILRGVLINILNPKLSIFFLAFLPQFVPTNNSAATLQLLAHAAIFMLMTFVVFIGYGLFAAALRTRLATSPAIMRWMRRSFAAAFAGLGLKLALAED